MKVLKVLDKAIKILDSNRKKKIYKRKKRKGVNKMLTGMALISGILLVFAIGGLIVEIPFVKRKLDEWYYKIH